MTPGHRRPACERARQWISLRADGELSDFEGFMLAAHQRRCAECRAFGESVDVMSAALREATQEPFLQRIEVPPRRRLSAVSSLQIGSAAAVATLAFVLATGGAGTLGLTAGRPSTTSTTPVLSHVSIPVVHNSGLIVVPSQRLQGRLKAE
jgi:predicted anti-sigma-YlaC factor YlaD